MSNDIEKRERSLTGKAENSVSQTTEPAASVAADTVRPIGGRIGRRGFLAGAGVAGAGVAAAALAARPLPQPQVPESSASARKDAVPQAGRGYHETAHIRKYYDTTKV